MRRSICGALLSALLLLTTSPSGAAEPKVFRLVPKAMKGIEHGKAVVVKGEAGPQPQRFQLEKLTSMMPIVVAVRPVRKGDQVAVTLTKYGWNQPLRQGTTDGDNLTFRFRTEGEFQISVSARDAGKAYRLLVWVGDEVKPEFRPVIVKASDLAQSDSGFEWSKYLPWIVAGVALVIATVFGLKLRGRKS